MTHDELREAIPEWVGSRLAPERRQLIEAHLEDCESCRATAEAFGEVVQALREGGPSMLDEHPEPTRLRRWADDHADPQITAHLRYCAACELEATVARSMTELVVSDRRRPATPGFWSAARIAAAAVAVVAALGLGYWLGRDVTMDSPAVPGSAVVPGTHPLEQIFLPLLRGGDPLGPFIVRDDAEYVALIVGAPLVDPSEASTYRFEISASDGSIVWSSSLSSDPSHARWRHEESLVYVVPARLLAPGQYELSLYSDDHREALMVVRFETTRGETTRQSP